MAPVTAVIIALFIGGLLIHSYIALAIIFQWLHGKPVTPIDQTIISLGISRMLLQIFSLLDLLLSIDQYGYLDLGVMIHSVISNFFIFFTYASIWFSTLFAFTFCLKVAPFSHKIFLHLKRFISHRVIPLIVLILVMSIGYTLMHLFIVVPHVGARNGTNLSDTSQIRLHLVMFLLVNLIPCGIYFPSLSFLIISLCLHINNMRANDNSNFHLNAYYMVINSMTFCFICYGLNVACNLIVLFYGFMLNILWVHVILNGSPIIHSIFLIYRTSYLRQYFSVLYLGIVHCKLLGGGFNSGGGVVRAT